MPFSRLFILSHFSIWKEQAIRQRSSALYINLTLLHRSPPFREMKSINIRLCCSHFHIFSSYISKWNQNKFHSDNWFCWYNGSVAVGKYNQLPIGNMRLIWFLLIGFSFERRKNMDRMHPKCSKLNVVFSVIPRTKRHGCDCCGNCWRQRNYLFHYSEEYSIWRWNIRSARFNLILSAPRMTLVVEFVIAFPFPTSRMRLILIAAIIA